MPREVIARRREHDGPVDAPLEERHEDLNVEWGKPATHEYYDGLVPLVDVPDEVVQVTIRQKTYSDRRPTTRTGFDQHGHLSDLAYWDEASHHEVYSAALTRKEINKLIATLRRARDQVFGTDV